MQSMNTFNAKYEHIYSQGYILKYEHIYYKIWKIYFLFFIY